MENRLENRERDERLEHHIDQLMANNRAPNSDATHAEQVAREFARLASEESPRLSNAARTQGIRALRTRAAQKRSQRRANPFVFLAVMPRWAQMLGVAFVVVLIANGITTVAADSLPGSLLYPFKRFGEGGQLLLQNTNGQRAQLWMNFANTRLDEVQRLLASGAHVYPSALDEVDESILRALAELSGTRGDERVDLLKKLTALAIRQQQIVNQLAQNASASDRARLEQTSKLLQGVASYAQSTDAVIGPDISPFQFLTPSATPTNSPTALPTSTSTPTVTPQPTATPSNTIPAPTAAPSNTIAPPTVTPSNTKPPPTVRPSTTKPPPTAKPTDEPARTATPVPTAVDDSSDNDNDNNDDSGDDDRDDNSNSNDNSGDDDRDDNSNSNDNSGDDDRDDNSNSNDNSGSGSGNDNNDGGDDNSGSGNDNNDGGDDNSGNGDNDNDNGGDDNGGDDSDNDQDNDNGNDNKDDEDKDD